MTQLLTTLDRAHSRPQSKKAASYRALLISQNGRRFYFATIPVDELFPCCFVARRDEDPLTGFQRALNEARADDIATYLSQGSGSIPSNIGFLPSPSPKSSTVHVREAFPLHLSQGHSSFLMANTVCGVTTSAP